MTIIEFDESLFSEINVKIYNKWGTKVFEWNEINYKWDGRGYSGEKSARISLLLCIRCSWYFWTILSN